jgi:aspartate aminotransferase, mitochondrial
MLHACAHNPTGVDPTEEQWREISHLFKVLPAVIQRDAMAIWIFLEDGLQIGCAQSFAKNMGLYGQRVGCLRYYLIGC